MQIATIHPGDSADCTDSFRAQDLLNGHLARIDAAQRFLDSAKARMNRATYASLNGRLSMFRGMCVHHLDSVIAAPLSAFAVLGIMGSNGHGHRIDVLIASVDFQVNRAGRAPVLRSVGA